MSVGGWWWLGGSWRSYLLYRYLRSLFLGRLNGGPGFAYWFIGRYPLLFLFWGEAQFGCVLRVYGLFLDICIYFLCYVLGVYCYICFVLYVRVLLYLFYLVFAFGLFG